MPEINSFEEKKRYWVCPVFCYVLMGRGDECCEYFEGLTHAFMNNKQKVCE